MLTKNVLLNRWCELTGDLVQEARHRVRMLSEDGLLPARSTPLNDEHLGRFLLGWLADTHKDAAKTVREFSDFRCVTASNEPDTFDLLGQTLLSAIVLGLTSRAPMEISRSTIERSCRLTFNQGGIWRLDTFGFAVQGGTNVSYDFMESRPLNFGSELYPIVVSKTLRAPLILKLTELLHDKRQVDMIDPKTTKAAEAPTSNGLQAKSEQAVKPAPVSTEQLTHTRKARQSRRRGGLPSPSLPGKA